MDNEDRGVATSDTRLHGTGFLDNGVDDEDDDEPPELLLLSQDSSPPSTERKTVPLTILSGFLGAGKTTLVQYILQSPDHGYQIAVIENEFADNSEDALPVESLIAKNGLVGNKSNNGLDSKLLDLIELPNGCVCCTVKDTLVQTLEALLAAKPTLDYIVLECSGMAHPGALATSLWLDEALESQLRLDGVVTVVDASRILRQLAETVEAPHQVVYGDRLLLNKCDLVEAITATPNYTTVEDVRAILQQWNPLVEIKETTHCRVPDLGWLLNANLWDGNAKMELKSPTQRLGHAHTRGVSTLTLQKSRSVCDLSRLNRWLADLLSVNDETKKTTQIWRAKGIVAVADDTRHYIVQAVYDNWQVEASSATSFDNPEQKSCQLIVIGKFLDEDLLHQGFEACLSDRF